MEQLDFDMNENAFDNFAFGRRRKPRRRKIRRAVREAVTTLPKSSNSLQRDMNKVRLSKRNGHKKILNKMRTQGFFANPRNHKAVYMQIRRMAKEIDGLSKKLIQSSASEKLCTACKKPRQKKRRYSNFDGGTNVKEFWNKYKTPLLIGGAVYFFCFSSMGKKMLK